MKLRRLNANAFFAIALCLAVFNSISARAGEMRVMPGHLPNAQALLHPLGRVPATNSLRLAISLPLHNRTELTNFLERLYDPSSPDYHHYLTPEQFNARFGPTAQEYQTVLQFAKSNGFDIVKTRDSRMLLDVQGKVADVEKAFHLRLRNYQHPTESRQFYAPDVEPTVDASLPILDVIGLSDYAEAHPMLHARQIEAKTNPVTASGPGGSGPDNLFIGNDFRNAYAPGVNLNGAGQTVGLLELDGYYSSNIVTYESLASLPNVPLSNVDVTNYTATPGTNVIEVSLDIEMAISMAPGLSAVAIFGAGSSVNTLVAFEDILDSMASSNQVKQFSSSWGYTGGTDPNTTTDQALQKMGTQGQSFFQASGDGDAWINPIWVPADSPYLTSVGGTFLSMNGTGASYASETVWNNGPAGGWSANENTSHFGQKNDYVGSGGGVSTVYTIPSWQTNAVINTNNQGSSTMRNIPDVALTGTNIFVVATLGTNTYWEVSGTSCAAPLWAGFTALVNQQAAAGGTSVGFINPAIYAIGKSATYTSDFHDINTGNNSNLYSTNLFLAVNGYDLCTGWGTPTGAALINALAPEPLQITPSSGFASSGTFGGPFSVTSENFVLTNTAPAPLNWSIVNTSTWLAVSPASGTLTAGGASATVGVSLNAAASNLTVGSYAATVLFSNLNDTVTQSRQFTLTVSKATPTVTWANPTAITYGAALTSAQLDATANAPGNFAYTPAAGAVLTAGTHTLTAAFTPSDSTDYNSVTNNVSLTVSPAPLSVTANNASRPYGTPNPTFTGTITGVVNGDNITATYSCSATTNSPVGTYPIVPALVDPNDRQTNYTVKLTNGTLTITMAQPLLTWATPTPVTYPTALGSNQLDAAANVPGNFAYTPSAGAVLNPGTNTLSVLFTPANTADYSNATGTVSLTVSLVALPLNIELITNEVVLTWNDPDSIFALQSATAVTNTFTNVAGATSPYTNAISSTQQYFQLKAN